MKSGVVTSTQPTSDERLVISIRPGDSGGGAWLRLAGEADLNSCLTLARTLAVPAAAGGDIHLDLTELAFADVAVARGIARMAAGLAPDRKLVLRRPAPAVRRLIQLCWPGQPGLEFTDE